MSGSGDGPEDDEDYKDEGSGDEEEGSGYVGSGSGAGTGSRQESKKEAVIPDLEACRGYLFKASASTSSKCYLIYFAKTT